jgi:GNAT superfamily N-acetyltransferase
MSAAAILTVRRASPADRPAIAALLRAGNEEHRAAMPAAFFDFWLDDLVAVETRERDAETYVVDDGDSAVGCVSLYADAAREGLGWPADWAGIRALTVDPRMRGRGVGMLLVERCLSRAATLGAPAVCLHTAEFMTAARRLYERFGFVRTPRYDFDAADLVGPAAGATRMPIIAYALPR